MSNEPNILLCDKNDWYEIIDGKKKWNEDKVNNFWASIWSDLEKLYKENSKILIEYKNVKFPKFQASEEDQQKNFIFVTNEKIEPQLCFYFEETEIIFDHCDFLDEADFHQYSFKQKVSFKVCNFKSSLVLPKLNINELNFFKCNFGQNDLTIHRSVFKSYLLIAGCTEIKTLNISESTFEDIADFRASTFQTIDAHLTVFKKMAIFIKTTFTEDVEFKLSIFEEITMFRDSIFEKNLNLRDAIFNKSALFIGIVAQVNRETARIIKDTFEKQNNIIEANRFYAIEMRERKKELNIYKNPIQFIVFYAHWISSNHSQNWFFALLWILTLAILGNENSFCNSIACFYFSDNKLDLMANSFKDMLKFNGTNITMYLLIIKLFMGYMIYQFIISIRQNTRR